MNVSLRRAPGSPNMTHREVVVLVGAGYYDELPWSVLSGDLASAFSLVGKGWMDSLLTHSYEQSAGNPNLALRALSQILLPQG